MEYDTAAWVMIGGGAGGLVSAIILVKMGFGRPLIGAVSKASRLALRAVTKRWRRS